MHIIFSNDVKLYGKLQLGLIHHHYKQVLRPLTAKLPEQLYKPREPLQPNCLAMHGHQPWQMQANVSPSGEIAFEEPNTHRTLSFILYQANCNTMVLSMLGSVLNSIKLDWMMPGQTLPWSKTMLKCCGMSF